MNELHEDRLLRDAMRRSLSGLQSVPGLEARIRAVPQADASAAARPRSLRAARLLLIPALLLMLATSAFAAERLGLFDLLQQATGGQLSPTVEHLVAEPTIVHATDTRHATLRVLECLRSGSDLILLIEATPKEEGLLLAPDAMLEDAASLLDSAESLGKQLVALDIHLNAPAGMGRTTPRTNALPYTMLECTLGEDGGVQLLLYLADEAFADTAADAALQLRFSTTPIERRNVGAIPDYALPTVFRYVSQERSAAFMSLTLPVPLPFSSLPTLAAADGALPLLLPDIGVRIDGVTLLRTPLYTRWEVVYTPLAESADGANIVFFLCDEQGSPLTSSLGSRSGAALPSAACTYSGHAGVITGTPAEIHLAVKDLDVPEPPTVITIPVAAVAP